MLFLLLTLAGYWALLIYQLSAQWSAYPQYNYGWAVPFLCAFLFWRKWNERPVPRLRGESEKPLTPSLPMNLSASSPRPSSFGMEERVSEGRVRGIRSANALTIVAIAALALVLLPIFVIQQANPIWRFASWGMSLITIGMTLGAIFLLGGRSWLKHFAFPVLYFLVAVPWPSALETLTIQTLTRWNAAVTTEIVHWIGIPAIQHGNVIEISTGVVGIDDACSGIRSFQATLMVSLFFGAFYRVSRGWRIGLVLSGFLFSFVFNAIRTSVLVIVAAKQGIPAIAKWHDPAGVSILLGCFTGLWLLAMWLGKEETTPEETEDRRQETGAVAPPSTLDISKKLGVSLVVWLGLVVILTEVWFRSHQTDSSQAPQWSVIQPEDKGKYRNIEIDANARAMLRFNEGFSFGWHEADGSVWQLVSFRWRPADKLKRRVEVALAKSHRPEICIRATGCDLKQELPPTIVSVSGLQLPFRRLRFDDTGRVLNVFYCVWDEGTEQTTLANMREDVASRFRAAWNGNRTVGQRVLEVAVWNLDDWEQAESMLREKLEEFIQVESNSGVQSAGTAH